MKRVALISGGSEGLGYEVARMLALDHTVIICAHEQERLEAVAKELGCDFEVCDVSKVQDIERMVRSVIEKHGRIDCLVNNAGIWIEGSLEDNDPAQIQRVIDVNVMGVLLLSRAVVPYMKKQGSGDIVNIVSGAGLYGIPERSVYASSKFAITGFTRSLQIDLAEYGIRVVGVFPGKMDTKLFEKAGLKKNMDNAMDPKEVAKAIAFVLSLDPGTVVTEICVRHIESITPR